VETPEIVECECLERAERLRAGHILCHVESHVRRRPSARGAAEHLDGESTIRESSEEADAIRAIDEFGDYRRGPLRLLYELQPFTRLKYGSVRERIEQRPIDLFEIDAPQSHPASSLSAQSPVRQTHVPLTGAMSGSLAREGTRNMEQGKSVSL
jgi:hypothetical protein